VTIRPTGRLLRQCAWLLPAAGLVVAALPAFAEVRPSQLEADSLARKVLAILQHADGPAAGARLTPVTEGEVNSFLRLSAADQLPRGVSDPELSMVGEGEVHAQAVVDLDAVRATGRQGDWLDPRQWLSGRMPVQVRGILRAANGWARFEVHTAEVSGVPVPKFLLQQIVSYYSRSPHFPAGVDLDAPFELPARIHEIHVNPRQAVVVQR
jgi:hypothetical protein